MSVRTRVGAVLTGAKIAAPGSVACSCSSAAKVCTCTSIHGAVVYWCSMESLEPAPTEEGFYLGGQIEKVLSELKEEAQPVQLRRYSRSFSEPNLFQHFMKVTIGAGPF